MALCIEENIKPLGASTLYRLLDECSALVRQSIEGLDNYIMEGCRAFKDLEQIVLDLGLSDNETKSLSENLQNAKRYLKSELKVHVKRENEVADHCLSFALSSTDSSSFKSVCVSHTHDLVCQDCANINNTLSIIRNKAETKEWQNKEAIMYTVEESISAIRKWKAHVLRSRNQEEARSAIVEEMTDADAIITCDWAMKFLPRKYREGQVHWFAKRGINWHITVSLLKNQSSFMTITHVHIFETPTPQDAAVTSQILIDVSKDIIGQRNGIRNFHFFSDNAGCYKSSVALLSLHQELSNNIVSYNFCEAQNGKGPCDRRASHIKSIIKCYVNEGNDVTTALQMKQAVDREGKDDIRVKVVTSVNILDVLTKRCSIPSISQMINFHFTEIGLRMWKAFSVGQGKLFKWDDIGMRAKTTEIQTLADWIGPNLSESNDEATEISSANEEQNSATLECPDESCTRVFSSQKALEKHIAIGDCSFKGVKMDISERAKRLYADKILSSVQPQRMVDLESSNIVPSSHHGSLEIGWALKEVKHQIKFRDNQKAFMVKKFNIGKVTGNKIDPYVAAEEMRNCG